MRARPLVLARFAAVGVLAAATITTGARAAEVTLNSGAHVVGTLVEDRPDGVVLRTDAGTRLVISRASIDSIDREGDTPGAAADAAPRDDETKATDVVGGQSGTHFGVGAGLGYLPGASLPVLGAVSLELNVGLPVGEVRGAISYLTGSSSSSDGGSSSFSAIFMTAEYRIYLGNLIGFGMGPLIAQPIGQGSGSSALVGFLTTPVAVRYQGFEVAGSLFLVDTPSSGVTYSGGLVLVSYLFGMSGSAAAAAPGAAAPGSELYAPRVAPPPAPAPTPQTPAATPAPAATAPTAKPDCSSPTWTDDKGHVHVKEGCE